MLWYRSATRRRNVLVVPEANSFGLSVWMKLATTLRSVSAGGAADWSDPSPALVSGRESTDSRGNPAAWRSGVGSGATLAASPAAAIWLAARRPCGGRYGLPGGVRWDAAIVRADRGERRCWRAGRSTGGDAIEHRG